MVFTRLMIVEEFTGNFITCIGSFEIIRSSSSNAYENIFCLSLRAQSLALLFGRT
jgi:hypothetical protein